MVYINQYYQQLSRATLFISILSGCSVVTAHHYCTNESICRVDLFISLHITTATLLFLAYSWRVLFWMRSAFIQRSIQLRDWLTPILYMLLLVQLLSGYSLSGLCIDETIAHSHNDPIDLAHRLFLPCVLILGFLWQYFVSEQITKVTTKSLY